MFPWEEDMSLEIRIFLAYRLNREIRETNEESRIP
jgi:hypothetical protein